MHDVIRIPLRARDGSLRGCAFVDEADAHLAELIWSDNGRGYAVRKMDGRTTSLHRLVMGLRHGDPLEVDHVNGDTLDNRRCNLRLVTRQQQLQNVTARGGSSRFRGVTWNQQHGKWAARATIDRQRHHLGYFDDEREAARAAQAFREQHMTHTVEARGAV